MRCCLPRNFDWRISLKASILIKKLKALNLTSDFLVAGGEPGTAVRELISIKHGTPFIVLGFGQGEVMSALEAISRLEALSSEAPFDPTITDARLGEGHRELRDIHHRPPHLVFDFGG